MCDFVLQNVWAIFETNFEKNMGENVRKARDVFFDKTMKNTPANLTRTNGKFAQKTKVQI